MKSRAVTLFVPTQPGCHFAITGNRYKIIQPSKPIVITQAIAHEKVPDTIRELLNPYLDFV